MGAVNEGGLEAVANTSFRFGSPLHTATRANDTAVVAVMLAHGANPGMPKLLTQSELDNANIEAGLRELQTCNTCHEIVEGKPATEPHAGPVLTGVFEMLRASREGFTR